MFSNFKYHFHSHQNKGSCVIYITAPFMDSEPKEIYERLSDMDFIFCELMVDDWDNLLTPWTVNDCLKGRSFGGHGNIVLDYINNTLLPVLKSEYPDIQEIYLAGYSLAGLFSLWALYETDCLDGAVCCSGSLWYPGWIEYSNQHKINKASTIYLSLGIKEEKTKHPIMKSVGDNTRRQYELLRQDRLTKNVILEWNEGGHFGNTVQRVLDGISWILQSQSDGRT